MLTECKPQPGACVYYSNLQRIFNLLDVNLPRQSDAPMDESSDLEEPMP